jgi:hypothetical protein
VGTASRKISHIDNGLPQVEDVDANYWGTGTVASRPGSGTAAGDLYFVQDSPIYRFDVWTGSAWVIATCKGPAGGTVDNRIARWDGTSGDQLNNTGITIDDNDKVTGAKTICFGEYNNGDSGTTKTIDWGNGQKQRITLTANCTISFTAPDQSGSFILKIIQNATGGWSVTWSTAKHPGTAADISALTANQYTIASVYYDGAGNYNIQIPKTASNNAIPFT